MRRLPVLSKTPAKISAKYLDGVSFGDVVALEVGESWFFDQEIKKEYFELVKDLSEKGVKIILNNRSIFNGEFFEKELSAEKFSQITSLFTSLFKGENILPINNIPTDSIYAKLGMLSEESGEILPCAKELQSQLGQLGPLGLRYIPSINLFRCGLGMIRDQLPKNTVLEGLVGGVVPIHLLDNLQDQKSGTIFSCGSYKVGALDNSYASSAASDLLDQKNIKRETTSASEMMDILNEKNLPEKTTTKKTAKFSASNFSQNAACVIL
jgi:hypothetical protein